MKRVIAILLCLCLALTGCQSRRDKDYEDADRQEDNDGEEDRERDNGDQDDREHTDQAKDGIKLLSLNSEWSRVITADVPKIQFTIPEYTARVAPYTIAEDLSNIENIDQFSGFTKEQRDALVKNGFVVLPTTTTRMHYTYDNNGYQGVPNFITADSVLHTYHQFYDKSLTSIESGFLYEDLDQLTLRMLKNSNSLLSALKEEDLKALQEKNTVFNLVARMLMTDTASAASLLQRDMKGENISISEELIALADQEYGMIRAAEGYKLSPSLNFDFDYSQFKVRGHYTKSEELGRFFRTMMWYGTVPLPLLNGKGELLYENTLQALLMSYATFMDSDSGCPAELWSRIYQPTSQYVGISDDIDVFTMNNLRRSVFNDTEDPNLFLEEKYYESLYKAVKDLPEPKIQPELVFMTTPEEKQFRYMGQRYILDSYVMQRLTESILRPYPSALDVMGVLGSDTAEDLMFGYYKPQEKWPAYEERYTALASEISGYGPDTWSENLYNGWIWSIQEALTEYGYDSGMPYFMTTEAWKYKALNTALGSYTELKHDTVLYGKQSVAEAGGDIEYADYHYVEPNVELYGKLLYLTDHTIKVLEEQGMMNEKLAEGAEHYRDLLELLIVCSVKELNNEMLTAEEYRELLSYGGMLEWISMLFLEGITGGYYSDWDITDMLVTDVATCQNTYVSLGTGYFDDIYVVIPVNGKLFLSRGSVYSHYEFISDTRLTDEEWWGLQGIIINHEEYGDYPEYTAPSEKLPKQPFWTGKFKYDVNNVRITPLEVQWEGLVQ